MDRERSRFTLTQLCPGEVTVIIERDDHKPGTRTLTVGAHAALEIALAAAGEGLANPTDEITEEVRDEKNFHLLLFTGSAVVGPATSNTTGPLTESYADSDDNGLPIGLTDTIAASAGTGTLTVTLRHMPPEEPPVKAANTTTLAKTGGIDSIGGSTDAQVNFNVTVQ